MVMLSLALLAVAQKEPFYPLYLEAGGMLADNSNITL